MSRYISLVAIDYDEEESKKNSGVCVSVAIGKKTFLNSTEIEKIREKTNEIVEIYAQAFGRFMGVNFEPPRRKTSEDEDAQDVNRH